LPHIVFTYGAQYTYDGIKKKLILSWVQQNPHEVLQLQYNFQEVMVQYTGTLPTMTTFY